MATEFERKMARAAVAERERAWRDAAWAELDKLDPGLFGEVGSAPPTEEEFWRGTIPARERRAQMAHRGPEVPRGTTRPGVAGNAAAVARALRSELSGLSPEALTAAPLGMLSRAASYGGPFATLMDVASMTPWVEEGAPLTSDWWHQKLRGRIREAGLGKLERSPAFEAGVEAADVAGMVSGVLQGPQLLREAIQMAKAAPGAVRRWLKREPTPLRTEQQGPHLRVEAPAAAGALAMLRNRTPFEASVNPGTLSSEQMLNDLERMAHESGYAGVLSPTGATLFEPVPVSRYAGGGAVKAAKKLKDVLTFDTPAHRLAQEDPARVRRALGFRSTVRNAQRHAFPGIYKDPELIALEAASEYVPESPNLRRLFGVGREDLARLAEREGNIQDPMRELIPGLAKNPTGSAAAGSIMTGPNAQRIYDAIVAAREIEPGLVTGMTGWYPMDPVYQHLLRLTGDPQEALRRYNMTINFQGIESPQTDPVTEMRRASAALYLANQGRLPEWVRFGGLPTNVRTSQGLLSDLPTVPGRMGHAGVAGRQQRMWETGSHGMKSPKAPLYIKASGIPEGRFQTSVPIADAHHSRGLGLADVRTNLGYDASVSTPELVQVGPWFAKEVAEPLGLQPVPGQAVMWGVFGPQTGVATEIGPPKLELLADAIARRGEALGTKDLESLRDDIIMWNQHLGQADPALLGLIGAGSAAGAALARPLLKEKEPEPKKKAAGGAVKKDEDFDFEEFVTSMSSQEDRGDEFDELVKNLEALA